MPIPLPNLDDRNFPDLFDEMQASIPRYAPDWTDHNISDPGIMLVELFVWLTEALMYRLNRIPEASQVRLLELLAATFYPARPATVDLEVEATGLQEELILPQGTPLRATPDDRGATLPFETAHDLTLTPDAPSGAVQARQTALTQDERLGTSDGQPHQVFHLAQSFLAGDPAGQSLVSEVRVGDRRWTYKPSLLELSGPEFTVEPRLGLVRFGDGLLGRIPPTGAEIVVSYRHTLGQEGNVSSRTEFTIDEGSPFLPRSVAEAIDSLIQFSFASQGDAYGGTDPTTPEEAQYQVTNDLKTRWRAITDEDFEKLVLKQADFNLARAKCLPEFDLSASDPLTPRPGHLSLIVVPDSEGPKPEPSPETIEAVWSFLDKRRLMTCRHHVVGPTYTDVGIRAEVVHIRRVLGEDLLREIENNVRDFFDPLKGGPEGEKRGWPFGRYVYASEVYQVIENTEGVDYVNSLTLWTRVGDGSWREAGDQVAIALNSLVHFVFEPEPGDIQLRAAR
jgi:hypothetical protein